MIKYVQFVTDIILRDFEVEEEFRKLEQEKHTKNNKFLLVHRNVPAVFLYIRVVMALFMKVRWNISPI